MYYLVGAHSRRVDALARRLDTQDALNSTLQADVGGLWADLLLLLSSFRPSHCQQPTPSPQDLRQAQPPSPSSP